MPPALDVLDVIAEPTRRRILDVVRQGECSVGELVHEVGMHQPGVSRHLRVLRDAGLVEVRQDAQRRMYRLRSEPLMELDAWLEPYRAEWATRLDALERHLQHSSAPTRPNPPDANSIDANPIDANPTDANPTDANPTDSTNKEST